MSHWNEGERILQREAGVREKLEKYGARIMLPSLPRSHRALLAELPFLVLGGMNGERPATAIAHGAPGWLTTPDERTLRVELAHQVGDLHPLAVGEVVGGLGIELATRSRIRLGGRVVAWEGDRVDIAVDVSFGNCPQYITPREVDAGPPRAGIVTVGRALGPEARALVTSADTFFLATSARPDPAAGDASEGVDVSHRGGPPGFVELARDGAVLAWPDFPGNNFFNSLGNVLLHPYAGLLFVDFARGDVLAIAGRAEVVRAPVRHVQVHIEESRFQAGALPLRFTAPLAPELD